MAKQLEKLLTVLDEYEINNKSNITITGITDDSRQVQQGYMFICVKGHTTSGYDYVKSAINNGAIAILTDRPIEVCYKNITIITVENTVIAMQKLLPEFFDYPALKMKLFAITGTNGKTTVTYMLKKIFDFCGKKTGVIGTIDFLIGDKKIPAPNTTPDVVQLQTLLYQMQQEKVEYVFMEVSSHALSLNRVAGCEFDVGALTNITQDHLDFHKTFSAYVQAKSLLFSSLNCEKNKFAKAVINNDDKNAKEILAKTKVPVLLYGMTEDSDIYPIQYNLTANGMQLELKTPQGLLELSLNTTGKFNIYNIMAAVAICLSENLSLKQITDGLNGFKGVSGRFELVEGRQPFTVIIDYAHTPDGLENVLKSARVLTDKRLIVVFGCGGNRDKTKRPIMGKIASEIADFVYVTSDNPRKEDPEQITTDIIAGIEQKQKVTKVVDRKTAICNALDFAQANDIVLIAGKGHETYQILGDKKIDFDDHLIAKGFLKEKYNA